jgi:hypothetical protein
MQSRWEDHPVKTGSAWTRISGALKAKEVPYLLTIAFALLGWGVTRIVDRVTSAPTVAYSCSDSSPGDVTCAITNISHDKVFQNVRLRISTPKRQDESPAVEWIGPCMGPEQPEAPSFATSRQQTLKVRIGSLHPGCTANVVVRAEVASAVGFWATCDGDTPIRVEPVSFWTEVARHERALLVLIWLLWLVVTASYGIWWAEHRRS